MVFGGRGINGGDGGARGTNLRIFWVSAKRKKERAWTIYNIPISFWGMRRNDDFGVVRLKIGILVYVHFS